MRSIRHSIAALLACVLIAPWAHAGSTGKISGVVRDSKTKEGLPGVNVILEGTTLGASTNVEGRYVILNVPPGRYTVSASYIGYRRFEARTVSVSVDFTTPLDLEMVEGSVELDAVVVQAERTPLIRQDLTNPVASISSENIESLPVTEISQVIGLQAGIVVDDDGSLHIRGGYGNEVAYTLNGININNPYGNARSVGLATNAVQEVSVSSGTFNAEYGTALSGVVNYITKEGGARWGGSLRYMTGDYLSNRTDLYFDIAKFQPANVNRVEGSLGGPILGETVTFFGSGVYNYDGGWLYGERIYLPEDSYLSREAFPADDPRSGASTDPYYFGPLRNDTTDLVGNPGGDGTIEPLNWSLSYNLQANLGLKISPEMKLKYEFVYDHFRVPEGTAFAHRYKPDGRALTQENAYIHSLDFTHSVTTWMFYSLKLSWADNIGKSQTFDDPYDPRYIPSFYLRAIPNTSWLAGGNDPDRFYRRTQTGGAKFDLVAQVFDVHEVKAGLEVRSHKLDVDSYTLTFQDPSDTNVTANFTNALRGYTFLPVIPSAEGGRVLYTRKPLQFAAYIQDKIELWRSFILNLGLRYDYFDPAAQYNTNLTEEFDQAQSNFLTENLADAPAKHMVQPRFSVSYPITDRGSIRFSYGHFYQIGSLASLYMNPDFRSLAGTYPYFGNPNVDPQKSIQYELGLTQGLTEDMRVEITGYYKDVSNYIYSQRVITPRGDKYYYLLTNLNYANTRGLSISLLKRRSPGDILSATLDYTFQVAEGMRTEPIEEVYYSEQSGRRSETYLVPQGFDRSHTLTSTITLSQPDDWSLSVIGFLRTGTPYTPNFPTNVVNITFRQNSDNQPVQWNVDLKAEKFFNVGMVDLSVFLQVDNLFDTENENYVYDNSGRALYNIEQVTNPSQFANLRGRITRGDPGLMSMSAVDRYYANPANVSRPRLVRLGASVIL